jgi:hypothetical protein
LKLFSVKTKPVMTWLALNLALAAGACSEVDQADQTATTTQGLEDNGGVGGDQCLHQVNRIQDEFERSLSSAQAVVNHYTTSSKFNPCTCGTTLEPASVTTVTGFDWHASPQWGFKAAERYEFASGDLVIIDTQTGYHNVLCTDGRAQWTNWLQWLTGDTVSHAMCSTLGCSANYPSWEDWCGELLVCPTDTYCTFPEAGATCPQ